jgi:phage shock protein C
MEKSTDNQTTKKLYRSKSDRLIGGVCGGIAEYFSIDPLIVRIGWVFVTLFAGAGIIAYIAALIVVPDNPDQEYIQKAKRSSGDSAKLWGSLLIIIGAIFLLRETGFFYHFHIWSFPWQAFMAAILIAFGIYLLYNKKNPSDNEQKEEPVINKTGPATKNYYRINENKMLAGVCTGLAVYFNIDVTLVRLLWVFATLASGGVGIIAYIIAIIVFPDVADSTQAEISGGKK